MKLGLSFIIFSFLMIPPVYTTASVFDSVIWEKRIQEKNIALFIHHDIKYNLNFYKAEIILNNNEGEKFFSNLTDFEKYPKIFPKTLLMKKISYEISEEKAGIYYTILNFQPMKNRDYYINLKYYKENSDLGKKYILEWWPLEAPDNSYSKNNNCLRVNLVYGRWQIIEKNNEITISVEYFNDFKISGPKSIIYEVEKREVIKALRNLLSYTLKNNEK